MCLDDPAQGAVLYRLGSKARVRSYKIPTKRSARPRQVAFAEECSRIVAGSDHGKVYVFDRRSGEVAEELSADSSIWIQTVLASSVLAYAIDDADRRG